MDARPRLAVLVLLCLAAGARADPFPPDTAVPLAVRDGRCEFVLPTPRPDAKFFLILGSLAQTPGPYRVTVRTEPCPGPAALPLEESPPDENWKRRVQALHARLAAARRNRTPPHEYPPSADPPRQKTFYLFTGEHDFQDTDSYAAVVTGLRGVGRRCLVYVDRDHPDPAALQPTVDYIVHTFDEEVYPRARRSLGQTLDVDRDGRFAVLLTGRLAKLQGGKVALGGFVRGSDFYRDLEVPFGNRCDVMFLNADLKPGPHLRTLLAHEYTHAVIFSEHVFGDYLPGEPAQDEESWLNEGLAHLAEDRHGYGWSNLDYRVSAFLSDPGRYRLVVADYYAAGLWRDPGTRGAAYLFLRGCADRHGADLPARLVQSNLRGVANLEAATREPFADLFRAWSAALLPDGGSYGPLGGRLLCGPRFEEASLAGDAREVQLAGTSAGYLLLHSPRDGCSRVTVTAEPGAWLQVSVVRLPDQAARLSLRAETGDRAGTVRLVLTAHDADVTLQDAAWERAAPETGRPEETSYRPDAPAGATVRAWFGDPRLRAGESRRSAPVTLPRAGGPVLFKVTGTDAAGRRVAAWARCE
jgi:hypothetical protein